MERKNTKIIVACFLLIAITCFGIFAAKSAKSADSKEYENRKIIKKSTEETTTSTVENTTAENTTVEDTTAKTEPSIDNNDTSSEA